jgi:nucleoid DNA-binding protein
VGRNPSTGQPVQVSEKRLPYFRAGKALRLAQQD